MPDIRRRAEIVERLLNDTCDVCGSKKHIQMHHVRHLADLNKKGRREKPLWMKIIMARKRKSIPLCQRCHRDVHDHRPKLRKTRRLESRVPCKWHARFGGGLGEKAARTSLVAYPTPLPAAPDA